VDWGEVYDANPVSIPLPPSIPSDVPTVTLSSGDGSRRLEIARSRANLFVIRQEDQESLDIKEIYPQLADQLATIFERDGIVLGRLAAVVHRAALSTDPAKTLARLYFQDRWLDAPLNRPEQLELHAHKVFDFPNGLLVNSWMRIRTAELVPTGDRAIAVEQDINTLQEKRGESNFQRGDVANFYRQSATELDAILRLYFPATVPL
jgi:hypothetical protein